MSDIAGSVAAPNTRCRKVIAAAALIWAWHPLGQVAALAREVVDDPRLFGLAWPVFGVAAALSIGSHSVSQKEDHGRCSRRNLQRVVTDVVMKPFLVF
jgi:hypothetical protein